MWEMIGNVLNGQNALAILASIVLILVIGIVLIKTGVLSINTKSVKIGIHEKERTIIRQQIEWARLYCQGMEARIPHPEGYDKWRSLYILEQVFDEIVTWITFNHISTKQDYFEIKCTKVINLVDSLTVSPVFQSNEFHELIKSEIENVIKKLVQIRELYD